ncbi:MAG TPA: hypothetical protein VMM92_14965, partial [Thermoanaerobaculia bacterium]|nr:hypothetical protein [Thermoanaerobaculia bacterium]
MAEDHHASPLLIAQLLAHRLEPQGDLNRVIPHLLAGCPQCQAAWEEVQRLQGEVGHWDELVAVTESGSTPELFTRLAELPHSERVRRIESDPRFHAWGLCRLLLKKSRSATFLDGQLAVDWASLALRLTSHLRAEYGPASIAALSAEAWATLGNAYRVIGELRVAEEAFLSAEQLLAQPGVATPALLIEIQSLEASLRLSQRRLPEARERLRSALALATARGDLHQVAKLRLKEAKILEEEGALAAAAALLRETADQLDPAAEPELHRV